MSDREIAVPVLPDDYPKSYIALLIPIRDDSEHPAEEGLFDTGKGCVKEAFVVLRGETVFECKSFCDELHVVPSRDTGGDWL